MQPRLFDERAAAYVPRLLLERDPDHPRRWDHEATYVLVDISGFTSLSEELARRGRVGTEHLVTTLAEVFSALLDAAGTGCDVVKFAGDALLLAFDGEAHAARACRAALLMRRTLGRVGRFRVAGVRARLQMSVGVHTGSFQLLLTGRQHDNLIVCGTDLDRLLLLQDDAAAGEVRISETTAGLLPPDARVEPVGGAFLLPDFRPLDRDPGAPTAAAPTAQDRAVAAVPPRLLPHCFAARPDLLDADSDHRHAAVGFLQVSGLGELTGDLGALVGAVDEQVAATCLDAGVTLLDTDVARGGYRYFVTAGAPVAVDDAEGRLVRALASLVSSNLPLPVRAGVATGRVFAGAVGSPTRRTYTVMGDTTNLAARLTSAAETATVLVHAPALDAMRAGVRTDGRRSLRVKGKADPVAAVVVRETAAQDAAAAGGHDSSFVGRASELDLMTTALRAPHAGRGGVVQVVGEPGVGKSRLAREASAASGLPTHVVPLDPYAATVPFHALGRLLERALDLTGHAGERGHQLAAAASVDPGLTGWLPLLAPVVGAEVGTTPEVDALDARFRRAKLEQVVVALLAAVVTSPTVFVLDDAQWVDPASADVLRSVLAACRDHPWRVVLTRRDTAGGLVAGDGALLLDLAPLSPVSSRELVHSSSSLRPADVEAVLGRADGNPLFLLELSGAAARSGLDADLPETVEVLVSTQVDALPRHDRDLVRAAAVLGTRFPLDLFRAVLGEPAPPASLADFLRLDGDDVVFTRGVHRDVSYEQLTFAARRRLHRDAARCLETQPGAAGRARLSMLSLHLDAAGDAVGAHRWSERAAVAAMDEHAFEAAVTFCRRAISNGRRRGLKLHDLRATYVRLAQGLFMSGQYAASAQAYVIARRGVDDPEEATSLTYELGMVRREEGRLSAASSAARRARALAAQLDGPTGWGWQAEVDLLEAGVSYWQGAARRCMALADRAAATAGRLTDGRRRTQLVARAHALWDTAAVEVAGEAARYGDEPLEEFERIGDLYNLTRFAVNVGYALFYAGDWDGAVARWRRSLAVAEQIGDVSNVAVNQMNIGELLGYQGHLDEARRLLRGALRTLVVLGTDLAAAHAACFLGVVERLSGDVDAAAAAFDRAEGLFSAAGRHSGFSLDELASRRLELYATQGAISAGLELGRRLVEAADVADVHRMRAHLGLAALHRLDGDPGAAAQEERAALALAQADPTSYDGALVLAACGTGEQRRDAGRTLARLGVHVEELPDPD